jgi:hypothetical protein
MPDVEVCTVSKRSEITRESPFYEMFRAILRESSKPCPYFKTMKALQVALVDDALEKSHTRNEAAALLEIHRNQIRRIAGPKQENAAMARVPHKKEPVDSRGWTRQDHILAAEDRVRKLGELMRVEA